MNISKEIYENNFDENIEFEPIADDRLDSTFTVIGENGEETECEILFTYHDDTDHNAPEAISYNQAKKITEFINKYKDDVDRMIFHCDAGVSRSAGCAAATMKYLFGSDEPIFNNRKYCPNLRCYRLVLNAFYDFC